MSILLPQTLVMHQNLDLKPQKTLKPQTSTLDPNLIQCHKERSLGKAELRLGDGEGEGRVEGDDGVHVGGEEGCLDVREGRGCREDEEREEGGASGNGEVALALLALRIRAVYLVF
ncbi:hypothetical protein B0H14DRAFT_2641772 [Mycena olivaceomarginata]|nr:hypothetical protein B0H14DRAFT_2641772 [Mycena olivaceomarginata]